MSLAIADEPTYQSDALAGILKVGRRFAFSNRILRFFLYFLTELGVYYGKNNIVVKLVYNGVKGLKKSFVYGKSVENHWARAENITSLLIFL